MLEGLWNWTHSFGMHFYPFLMIIVGIIAAICASVHGVNQKNREKSHDDEIEKMLNGEDPGDDYNEISG